MIDELTPEEQQIDDKADAILAEEALLKASRENLDKVFGDEPNPEPEPEPEPKPTSDGKPEPDPQKESEPEPEPEPEPTGEQEPEPEPGKAGDEPKLTQAEIRAAIHLGWSEDEVKELEQANPELAKKTCTKALESTNNLSKKFSELGKTAVEKPAESEPKPQPESKPKPKSIDFTALEKEYENDPIVGVLKQVVEQNQTLAEEVNTLRATGIQTDDKIDKAQAQQDAAIAQQIDAFFTRPDVTEYGEVYGEVPKGFKDWDTLTQGQIKKRWEVVEQANLILLGAQQQGMDMSLDEAFERAHLLVTEDVREQTIRKKIKKEAVKRSKGITLEPADSKRIMKTGAKTMDEVHQNAKVNLQKVFRS